MISHRTPRPDTFTLIADDFAMTAGISDSILELAAAGRLSGTGAMTNRPYWPRQAQRLAALGVPVEAGLHFNLTFGAPCGPMPALAPGGAFPGFAGLIQMAFSGRLDLREIEAEARRQLDAFAQAYGEAPAFVDGHQHVHVLPGVRSALLRALSSFGFVHRPWLRDPFDTPGRILARGGATGKALVIAALSLGWRRHANTGGFATNRGFSGVSAFDPRRAYDAEFATYLRAPGPDHLVMCHPGHVDAELERIDPVVGTRPLEHRFLIGSAFDDRLAEARLSVARRR